MTQTEQALPDAHEMQCREIWGGFEASDQAVSLPGMDVQVLSRPHRGSTGGGDVHYLGLCSRGVLSRYIVADVSGHGDAVSRVAGELRDLMRQHMDELDQSELVSALNREFTRRSDEGQFATAMVASYDARYDNLVAVNAGHPRPLWYCAPEDRWQLFGADRCRPADSPGIKDLPLGVLPETGYLQFAQTLSRGDILVVYTDSLIEAEDAAGKDLGEQGLLELARSIGPMRIDRLAHQLHEAVREYAGGGELEDDVTVLVLGHNAEDTPAVKELLGAQLSCGQGPARPIE